MARDWSRYRASIRDLGRLLRYDPPKAGPEEKLFHGCEWKAARVGVIDADPMAFALVMIWRALCYPSDTTLIVLPNRALCRAHVELAEGLVADGTSDAARQDVWVMKDKSGLVSPPGSVRPAVVACLPQILDFEPLESARQGHLMILIPDIDAIPGCYLNSAAGLSRKPNISVVFHAAR